MLDQEIFDSAIKEFFEPLAKALGFPMLHPHPQLYEVVSPFCSLRIRYCSGHGKSIIATLKGPKTDPKTIDNEMDEYGIAVIATLNDEQLLTSQVSDSSDFLKQASIVATAVKKFGVQYLIGEKRDFDQIREHVARLVDESGIKQKKWSFPKNVREEWIIPDDKLAGGRE